MTKWRLADRPWPANRVIQIVLYSTVTLVVVELIGGYRGNSKGLITAAYSDAIDIPIIIFALIASILEKRPTTNKATYGFLGIRPFVTLINALIAVGAALILLSGTFRDLHRPSAVSPSIMISLGLLGVLINGFNIYIFKRGPDDPDIRALYSGNMGDLGLDAAIITSAILIRTTGITILDRVIALGIATYMLWTWGKTFVDSGSSLLGFVPRHIDLQEVHLFLLKVQEVEDIHDLHIWSVGWQTALSCHVVVKLKSVSETEKIMDEMRLMLDSRFNIWHTTFQFENDSISIPCGATDKAASISATRGHRHTRHAEMHPRH